MIADKIGPQHLERKAILYVRQSSAHQVLHNRESGALQYAMRDRLTTLGFTEIDVIDEDLGRSAAGGVQHAGFERMVAEVWRPASSSAGSCCTRCPTPSIAFATMAFSPMAIAPPSSPDADACSPRRRLNLSRPPPTIASNTCGAPADPWTFVPVAGVA